MTPFVRTTVSPARQRLAALVVMLAILGAGYVAAFGMPAFVTNWGYGHTDPAPYADWRHWHGPPAAIHWKYPAAVLLGLVGLVAAAALAGWRRAPRQFGPDDVPVAWR